MGKTVLEIGNAAASACGLPQQTSLIGNSNQNAVRILQSVKDAAGRDVFRGQDWVTLQNEHTFTNGSVPAVYALPTDYDRIINGTIWDRTNERSLVGPVTAQQWQRYESGLDGLTGLTKLFRIWNSESAGIISKKIRIYPGDADGATIAFEYISKDYVVDPNVATFKDEVDDDGDSFLFDDDLVEVGATWRLLRNLGMTYADERIEFETLIDERSSNDGGAGSLSMQLRSTWQIRDPNIPDTGYGA